MAKAIAQTCQNVMPHTYIPCSVNKCLTTSAALQCVCNWRIPARPSSFHACVKLHSRFSIYQQNWQGLDSRTPLSHDSFCTVLILWPNWYKAQCILTKLLTIFNQNIRQEFICHCSKISLSTWHAKAGWPASGTWYVISFNECTITCQSCMW